jgi:hypothetical protein
VLVRARAPLATVHRVIATPEQYRAFMPAITHVDVLSRHGGYVAFRFAVAGVVFDVTTLSALHELSERRIDVAIVQSDIGMGASRWDLVPDGDGTLVALSTWGDPSRGNWMLQQIARRSPAAVASMNISTDLMLALGVARRAEIVSGRALPVRPPARDAAPGVLEPPPPGPWTTLARTAMVGTVSLDPAGAVTQSSIAGWTPATPEAVSRRLADVAGWTSIWRSIRALTVVAQRATTVRYHVVNETAMARAEGDEECTVSPRPGGGFFAALAGVSGDFAGQDHRWDVLPDPAGGAVVVLTGGSEWARTGWIARRLIETDPWLMPGYSVSWKLVWIHPLLSSM